MKQEIILLIQHFILYTLYYLFPSKMLDGLEIIETIKPKCSQNDNLDKQQKFNMILDRLKQRNIQNQIYIKKFVRKIEKKHLYSKEFKESINIIKQVHPKCITQIPDIRNKFMFSCFQSQLEDISCCSNLSPDKQNTNLRNFQLFSTKDTVNEETVGEEKRTTSFPSIDLSIKNKEYLDQNQELKSKGQNSLPKNDKIFTNYLKNTLFKQMVSKAQQKNRKKEINQQELVLRPYRGRLQMKNDASHQKYQLNIKSLVFGNEQMISYPCIEREDTGQLKNGRLNDSYNKLKTSEKGEAPNQFQDINIINENQGFFPTINLNHVNRNKRGLQLFIKLNIDKTKFKSKMVRPANLQNESTQQSDSLAPINQSFIINTIQLKKQV